LLNQLSLKHEGNENHFIFLPNGDDNVGLSQG